MTTTVIAEQLLNGLGYGLMLFLLAAGLSLVFGVMDTMNLAHGSLFMFGAYIGAATHQRTDSFTLGIAAAVIGTCVIALILERTLFRKIYASTHLVQVVVTVGIILVADDAVKSIWGAAPLAAPTPEALTGAIYFLADWPYPAYRILILVSGIVVAGLLFLLVNHTRLGMLVRAGASNRLMAELMGTRVRLVFATVFVLGAALAGFAGVLMGPLAAVQAGMGEAIMIPALVVIVIGGIGSIRGAFIAALLVGFVDTAGRAFLPLLLKQMLSPSLVADVAPAAAGMMIYILMALVLALKPNGLFPSRG